MLDLNVRMQLHVLVQIAVDRRALVIGPMRGQDEFGFVGGGGRVPAARA